MGFKTFLTEYFSDWNRNKRSITRDKLYPKVKEMVLGLAGLSDVVIENLSTRVVSNWGLD